MKKFNISLIPGDGIGPELTNSTLKVLDATQGIIGIDLNIHKVEAGDECAKKRGVPLPEDTIETIKNSDACLKGPVGESAADVIVRLRLMFDLFANIRPVKTYPNVPCIKKGIDMVIVRENTEDLYKGLEFEIDKDVMVSLRVITRKCSERIARYAFELARKRRKSNRVTAIHKSNVMRKSDGLFASVCREISNLYQEIKFDELYVDAAAMELIKRPDEFDVLVTTNMFGDILSDEASMLVGGLGMAPGANIGNNFAIFEPVHGSAPKYAGKNIANPCSMILASSLMLEWLGTKFCNSDCIKASEKIQDGLIKTLKARILTQDLGGDSTTMEFSSAVVSRIIEAV